MNSQQPSLPPEYKNVPITTDPNTIPLQARQAMQNIPPEKAFKSAANNFYTIAVLSFVNSLISAFGGGFIFVIGLGITQLVDAIAYLLGQEASESKVLFTGIALIFDLGACVIFALFGYFASKEHRWAITTGIVLYTLDALLVLFFKDWVGLAFHVFFLWQLWMMQRILGLWQKVKKPADHSFPQDIGIS